MSSSDESEYSSPPSSNRGSYGTACVRCRELKQRCDSSVPTCTRCASAGAKCLRMSHEGYYDYMRNTILHLEGQIKDIDSEMSTIRNNGNSNQRERKRARSDITPPRKAPSRENTEELDTTVTPLKLDIEDSCLMSGRFPGPDIWQLDDGETLSPETMKLHERLFECRQSALRENNHNRDHEPNSASPASEARREPYQWELEITPTGIRIQTDIHGIGDLYEFLTTSASRLSPCVQKVMEQSF
ncbi:hypothetical protein BC936DRAFT_144087 [Jimgerdemannia flammicorona]|uniref:Zn(2)-C6 fungal-type domain-containing protein n=1 Tax=Jimgerdemannia flammicorona TaxID=994334 RepID=A0A433DD09_9FUNG|nr:hypothetical protein BC936DRAFT_144087 [Jimgerdemannia flammicorona]